jgi:D-alanyl-D-alanine carboxypeptidase/D-alanyl-D-alanine-endopeptidase (penicillin-binding protein 4)
MLLVDTAIRTGHIGISLFEPSSNSYWYNYNATHYFIPASNTKLFSFYTALKYLKDSLVAAQYDVMEDSILVVEASADPSFLQPTFTYQPLFDLMKQYKRTELHFEPYRSTPQYGYGWSWDDYEETYMPLPSQFPIYGNQLSIQKTGTSFQIQPPYFRKQFSNYEADSKTGFQAKRSFNSNSFWTYAGKNKFQEIPFIADINTVVNLLQDTLHTPCRVEGAQFVECEI